MTFRKIDANQMVSTPMMELLVKSLNVALSSHLFMVRAFTVELDKVQMIIPLKVQEVKGVRAIQAVMSK
jgi:hypothetical protein